MKRLIVSSLLTLSVVLVSSSGEAFERRKGLELEGRLGSNSCIDNGDYDCDQNYGYKSGFGGGGFLGLRPLSFLAIGIDAAGYSLTPRSDSDPKSHTTQVMLGLRLYIPFNLIEPFVKLGVGYLSIVDDYGDDEKVRIYSWGNFKFGFGATLYLIDSKRIGNFGVGLDLDFSVHSPSKWKECGGSECESGDWEDDDPSPITMQFNLHFKWIIPIL